MLPTDRVREVLLDALGRALATPGEHRLFRAGKLDGLFFGRGGIGGEAAARALADGLLERARVEVKGKTEIDWVRVTPRGVEFLHDNQSPVRALHELQSVLRANRSAIPVWLDDMRGMLRELDEKLTRDAGRWLDRLQALDRRVGETLRRLEAANPLVPDEILHRHPWTVDALNYLDRRRTGGAPDPCPLPELFAALAAHHPALEIGAYHDGLKLLHRRKALLLLEPESPEMMAASEYALFDESRAYYLAAR